MWKGIVIFAAGAILGGCAGAYLSHDAGVASRDARVSVHTVRELVSHQSYPEPGTFTDTELVVSLEANDGNDATVLCQFGHGSFDPEQLPERVSSRTFRGRAPTGARTERS